MNKLQVGFARLDNTPPLGAPINGYTFVRYSEGVLDPLEIHAVAIGDGTNTVILIAYDSLGVSKDLLLEWRGRISKRCGVPVDSIYITASHSHTAPAGPRGDIDDIAKEYFASMARKIEDAAVYAVEDMRPAKMGYGIGEAKNVAFCRRYKMKDGSCMTNPGVNNPDIVAPMNEVDTRVSVVRFDREGAESVVIVNFANHPDVIGGNKISADWPGAARRFTERVLDNVRCVVVNGCQGDVNHVNVHPTGGYGNDLFHDFDDVDRGYNHAQYIGRVITAGVLQTYDKVKYVDVDTVSALVKTIKIPSNKPKPEELPEARRINQLHLEGRDSELPYKGMMLTTVIAEAACKIRLANAPETFDMDLIALRIGNLAFLGIPGEPFNEIGNQIKRAEGWDMVVPTCLTNGYQGYFPTFDAYAEGGYEARHSNFKAGVAERIIAGAIELLKEIKA